MRPGKAPLPYQDGRRDLIVMPEYKRGRGELAVVLGTQGWLGRIYCHARNTREVGEILLSYQKYKDSKGDLTSMPGTQEREGRISCRTRNTRMVGENLLPCQEHKRGRGEFLLYQEHKDGRREFTAIPKIQ